MTNAHGMMKKVSLTGIRQLRMESVPIPAIQHAPDVKLRIACIGVCGSDMHYYTSGRIGAQVVRYPFAVGHECAAIVEETGPAVTRVKPGDLVAVEPAMSCGNCDQCHAGRHHTCRTLSFLGCPGQQEGCMTEFMVMPEACCFPVGPNVTPEAAAWVEPLSIGIYAAQLAGKLSNAHIGVLGCGPIGLSVIMAARQQGVRRIWTTDKLACRLQAARRAGADAACDIEKEDADQCLQKEAPLQLDIVFECCGRQSALDQAVAWLKPGGKLLLIGIPETDRVTFNMDLLRRKEICIQNVRRQNGCVAEAVQLITDGILNNKHLTTHRFSLEQSQAAFDLVADYRDEVIKAMIYPGQKNGAPS
jgi:L-iditol 2-dehydrogenase